MNQKDVVKRIKEIEEQILQNEKDIKDPFVRSKALAKRVHLQDMISTNKLILKHLRSISYVGEIQK